MVWLAHELFISEFSGSQPLFPQMLRIGFLRQRPHTFVECCSDGFKRARASGASQRGLKESATKRSRSNKGDPSSWSNEPCAKTAPVGLTPRRCRWSDGPRSFLVHRIETGRDCACRCRQWNGQHQVGGQWDGLGTEPCRGDDEHRKWRPSQYHCCLPHEFKMDEYRETEGKHIYQENVFFLTRRTVIWIRLCAWRRALST